MKEKYFALLRNYPRQFTCLWLALSLEAGLSGFTLGWWAPLTVALGVIALLLGSTLFYVDFRFPLEEPRRFTARRMKRRTRRPLPNGNESWDPDNVVAPKLFLSDDGHAPEEGETTYCPRCETVYEQPGFCGNIDCVGFSRQELVRVEPPRDPSWKY